MDKDLREKSKKIINDGIIKILKNYTKYALLINACFISKNRYETLDVTDGLSTIKNIPSHLRLDREIDFRYTNAELVNEYMTDVLEVVFRNYLVMSISLVDAVLEDLYELFIVSLQAGISESELNKKVREAWVNNNLLNYFVAKNGVNLKKPDDNSVPYEESFMRYKELRLLRHSLVHDDGLVSDRSLATLREFKERTPVERRHDAMIDSPMIQNSKKVTLSINKILSVRQQLHRFLIYQLRAIENA